MIRWRKTVSMLLLWLAVSTQAAEADLVVQGYDAARHNRFTNSSEFLGNPHDWSGIGRRDVGGRWATMISPSYFLSAFHAHPELDSTVRFYESNDASGAFVDRSVESGLRIAGSDLWLGKLSSAVGPTIQTYPILGPASLTGQTIQVWGQNGSTGMRLGRNEIDEVLPDFSDPALGSSHGDVFVFDYDTADGLGADESRLQGGDSGGPTFAIVDGVPALLGIHWFIYESDDGITIERGSGDTLVSSYLTELTNSMVGESLTIVAIPEPAAVWLLSVITIGLVIKSVRA